MIKLHLERFLKYLKNISQVRTLRWKVSEYGSEVDLTKERKSTEQFKNEGFIKSLIPKPLVPMSITLEEKVIGMKEFWQDGYTQKVGEKTIGICSSNDSFFDSYQEAETYAKSLNSKYYISSVAV